MNMEPFTLKNKYFMEISPWKDISSELIVGFTTSESNLGLHVNDTTENVIKNRKNLADILKFSPSNWVCSEQTHGNHIEKITKDNVGAGFFDYNEGIKDTDGLYTSEKNILLTLCFADCVPLYFYAPGKQYIGIAHAGWKGTVKDIGGKMVRMWNQEGIKSEEIHVAIGPSIGECCYVVDDYVINFVRKLIGDKPNRFYKEISDGQYTLNLQKLNEFLLISAGIPSDKIQRTSFCTSCSSNLFFSHRRDKGQTGRMMSFIGLNEGEN